MTMKVWLFSAPPEWGLPDGKGRKIILPLAGPVDYRHEVYLVYRDDLIAAVRAHSGENSALLKQLLRLRRKRVAVRKGYCVLTSASE